MNKTDIQNAIAMLHAEGYEVKARNRIVITQYSNINIPEEKFPAIKKAIEGVLNDDKDELLYDGISSFLKGLKYTEEELIEAERRAWYAARHPQFSQMQFEDYKGSIK